MLISYKKFIVYLFTLSIILLGSYSYFVLNYKMLYMNREYPMWIDVQNKINIKSITEYNFICIGDSRAKAGFIPNIFDANSIKSVNLALGGGTPIEGYFIFKNYLLNNNPKYILLSYAPFHLAKQDCYWSRTVRFNFLKDKDYKNISIVANDINDNQTLGNDNYLNYKLYVGKYLIEFYNGILSTRWQENYEILKYLKKSKGHYYFGRANSSSGLNIETKEKDFTYSPLINYYLEECIKLANSKKIKVYWYTIPFNESSFKQVSPNYKNLYYNYIHNLSEKYNFTILNELYYVDNSNFGDSSHLYNGAEKITYDIKYIFNKLLEEEREE